MTQQTPEHDVDLTDDETIADARTVADEDDNPDVLAGPEVDDEEMTL